MLKTKLQGIISKLQNQLKSEKGQAMTESGLIIVLVAAACIVILSTIGQSLVQVFERLWDKLLEVAGWPI